MSEMIFIFLAALILVGPKKLPEIMRQVGKWTAEFKRASNEFKWQIETEMRSMELEAERAKQTVLPPVTAPQGTIANGAVVEALPPATPAQAHQELTSGALTNGTGESAATQPAESAKSGDA